MAEFLMTHRIPESLTPLGEWLAEVADKLTLITDQHAFPTYQETFPDVYAVPGYSANNAVEVLLQEVFPHRRITTLIHSTEDDILRCARVRDRFGISGLRYQQAVAWRDKYEMKRLVTGHVPVPSHTVPRDVGDALDFAQSVGYPVVVKPRTGFASRGVTVVADAVELTRLVDGWDADDLLLEAFVAGPVLHMGRVHRRPGASVPLRVEVPQRLSVIPPHRCRSAAYSRIGTARISIRPSPSPRRYCARSRP